MMVQFIVQFFDSIADINGEPGKARYFNTVGSLNGTIFFSSFIFNHGFCLRIRVSSSIFSSRRNYLYRGSRFVWLFN